MSDTESQTKKPKKRRKKSKRKKKKRNNINKTPLQLKVPLNDAEESTDSDLTIYKETLLSIESFVTDQTYIKSYKYYSFWNGIRFILISGLILGISIQRQMRLYHYYDDNRCCCCYETASKQSKHTIFEWASCEYDIGIKEANIYQECQHIDNTDCHPQNSKIKNLSTNYDLFGAKVYYIKTASIVCGIGLIYSFITMYKGYKKKTAKHLMRNCLYLLLYNIIISILYFYQILIDYQYYHKDFDDISCYVNALSDTAEIKIKTVLILAGIYFIIPCIVQCLLHCTKNDNCTCCAKIIKSIYNWVIFGGFGVVISLFSVVIIYYTYNTLKNHQLNAMILVCLIDIGLISSFFDILLFKIRYYVKTPFIKIWKLLCCCYYKYCTQNNDPKPYHKRYPSDSIN